MSLHYEFQSCTQVGSCTGTRSIGNGGCTSHCRWYQEYISSKSVQLLQTAFLHIDVTRRSVNPISGGTSCTYVNHSLHGSFSQTNHIQPEPFKGPDSVVDS